VPGRFDETHLALMRRKVAVRDFLRYAGALVIQYAPVLASRWPKAVRRVQLISGQSPPNSPPTKSHMPTRPMFRPPSLNRIVEEV